MKAQRRFASGPAIARLLICHRMSANEAMRAGRYGPTFFRRGVRYADLEAVANFHGVQFSDEQIARASEGRPDRIILTFTETEETKHVGQGRDSVAAGI